jgi:hypothetical protein
MDNLYAALCGISGKVYDDLYDNKLTDNQTIFETLKGSQWILLTLLSYSDFNFAFLFYIINVLNFVGNPNGWKPAYENALLIFFPFLVLISYHTVNYLTLYDMSILAWFVCVMAFEPYFIPEERGFKKLISRSLITIGLLTGLAFSYIFPVSVSIRKIIVYSLGYVITSVGFQLYLLSDSTATTSATTSLGSTG